MNNIDGGVKCGTEKVFGATTPKLEVNLFWAAETGEVQTAMQLTPAAHVLLVLMRS